MVWRISRRNWGEIARDLGYLRPNDAAAWLMATTEIKRMLTGLLKKLKTDN